MATIYLPSILSSGRLDDLGRLFNETQTAIQNDDHIVFDFSRIRFVEPFGYTSFFNLIRWLGSKKVKVSFSNFKNPRSRAIVYMDDCGFFKFFGIDRIRENASLRDTTISDIVSPTERHSWFDTSLVAWLSQRTDKNDSSFGNLKISFLELFQNIQDHSQSDKGAVFAQHYPATNKLIISISDIGIISISDIGIGIPETVRTKLPSLCDSDCIEKACELGFTSGSTIRNAGRGLANLTDSIIRLYQGTIKIVSSSGYYEICENYTNINKNELTWSYPGTSIEITIDIARLPDEPLDVEDFEW